MKKLVVFSIVFTMYIIAAQAQDTRIVVRVKALDAKFIGDNLGGAEVIIRDVLSDSVMARGFTRGTTGDTDLIMKEPRLREKSIVTPETAAFLANLYIDEPRLINIEARSPLYNSGQNLVASRRVWLVPGEHIENDGIILDLSGFLVRLVSPLPASETSADQMKIMAQVMMMCGCPVAPEGLWDSDDYIIKAVIKTDKQIVKSIDLVNTGEKNMFSAGIDGLEPGYYTMYVYAFDPKTGNTGVDQTVFKIIEN